MRQNEYLTNIDLEDVKLTRPHNKTFPFHLYNKGGKGHIMTPHWHEELELLLIKRGKAISQLNSVPYKLNPGDLHVINKEIIHSLIANDCYFYCLVFDLKILKSKYDDDCQINYIKPLLENNIRLQPHISPDSSVSKKIINLFQEIINVAHPQKEPYKVKLKSILFDFIYEFYSKGKIIEVNHKSKQKAKRLRDVLLFIHHNYDKNISLKQLADISELNESYFSRYFKKQTGKSPIEYLNFYRINKAKEMLQKKNPSVKEISNLTGFNNFSYFIKVFKEYEDCTPLKYRNNIKDTKKTSTKIF